MITREIDFHAPRTLDAALALLAEHGAEATLLAGGMSLLPTMNLGLAQPGVLVSLNHVAGLDVIAEDAGALRLGALVRHARLASDPLVAARCPLLAEAARHIGDVQVRNRGTLGGSLAHADPAADYLPVLAALDARIELRGATTTRTLPAGEFFVDLLFTAREPTELISAVVVPSPPAGAGWAYRRLTRVEGSYALVAAAALLAPARQVVALGGATPRPVVVDVAPYLAGAPLATALGQIEQAAIAACDDVLEDLHADAVYRRAMAGVYARRAVEAAAQPA